MPKPRYHAAVSLALAGVVVAQSRRWTVAIPVQTTKVFADFDHQEDHREAQTNETHEHVYLPLHAWEWVLSLLAWRERTTEMLAGGLATHLALDQLNPAIKHPFFYWIVVRAAHGFRAREPLVHKDVFERASRWTSGGLLDWF